MKTSTPRPPKLRTLRSVGGLLHPALIYKKASDFSCFLSITYFSNFGKFFG